MNCGKEFPGDGLYCEDCMQQLKQEDSVNESQAEQEESLLKKYSKSCTFSVWMCLAGIAVGVCLMIFAIVLGQGAVEGYYNPDYDGASFGGDFYTYIYEKTVDINSSIRNLSYGVRTNTEVIARELGCLIGGFGTMLSLLFGIRLCKIHSEEYRWLKQTEHFQEENQIADAQLQKMDELCELLRGKSALSEDFAADKKKEEV